MATRKSVKSEHVIVLDAHTTSEERCKKCGQMEILIFGDESWVAEDKYQDSSVTLCERCLGRWLREIVTAEGTRQMTIMIEHH